MINLKPCPFCGCTDNYIDVTPNPFSNDIYSATHCKCYATGPFIAENYLTGEKVPTREHMEERATERWNTRPIEDALQSRIAELKEYINQLIEAGNLLDVPPDDFSEEQKDWRELVKDWKEG